MTSHTDFYIIDEDGSPRRGRPSNSSPKKKSSHTQQSSTLSNTPDTEYTILNGMPHLVGGGTRPQAATQNMMQNADGFLTVREAADLIRVTEWTIRYWARTGLVRKYPVGKRAFRLSRAELLDVLRERRAKDIKEGGPR